MNVRDVLAERVRKFRKDKGWTVSRLSAECSALGVPITEASLTNIERKRRALTVEELLAIARALEIPPVLLLIPFGEQDLDVTPIEEMHVFDLFRWVVGDYRGRGSIPFSALPIGIYDELSTAIDEVRGAEASVLGDDQGGGESGSDPYPAALARLTRALNTAATVGLALPPIEARWVRDMRKTGQLRAADQVSTLSESDSGPAAATDA